MKKLNKVLLAVFVILLFTIIITPHEAFNGTMLGLKLWAFTVLPGLFPAALLSSIVLRIFPIKKSFIYSYIILAGVLCGFPVGGILIAAYCRDNQSDPLLMRIMPLCNISSPSFMLNYVFTMSCFKDINISTLLLCTYLPVFICLGILIFYEKIIYNSSSLQAIFISDNNHHSLQENLVSNKRKKKKKEQEQTYIEDKNNTIKVNWCSIIDEEMGRAVKNMLKLGGYIVIFSCVSNYIYNIYFIPELYRNLACGIAEITNGIFYINNMQMPITNKAILILAINAFGGISTLMQTVGIGREFVHIKKYICGKLLYVIVTILVAKILLG